MLRLAGTAGAAGNPRLPARIQRQLQLSSSHSTRSRLQHDPRAAISCPPAACGRRSPRPRCSDCLISTPAPPISAQPWQPWQHFDPTAAGRKSQPRSANDSLMSAVAQHPSHAVIHGGPPSLAPSAVSNNAIAVAVPCDATVLAVRVHALQSQMLPDPYSHPLFHCLCSLAVG